MCTLYVLTKSFTLLHYTFTLRHLCIICLLWNTIYRKISVDPDTEKRRKKCLLSNAWLQKSHSTSYPTGWVKRFPLNLRVQTNNFPSRLSFDIFNANNGKAHRSTSIFNAIFMSDNDIWNYIHTTSLVWTNNTSFEKILTACEGFVI